jgi:hypothetical protein
MFKDTPCPNCGRCSDPLVIGQFIPLLHEADNHQLKEEYKLAFDKAFKSTQLIEQAIQDQFKNTDVFSTKWKDIKKIAHQKSVQKKDSEEAIKVAKDFLELYVNENNKCCSKNKNR